MARVVNGICSETHLAFSISVAFIKVYRIVPRSISTTLELSERFGLIAPNAEDFMQRQPTGADGKDANKPDENGERVDDQTKIYWSSNCLTTSPCAFLEALILSL